ncbi:PREDICTED: uncharacterized protein LOC105458145 [Wasmannia auropunctata]|uniref:uncharacterized protein LOC105458145 n=1 Tax=Wasmannia auropunctata TaxID=64793 RepID=UPI0005EED1CC|nr:PREDICTED: uncharacterized protein LOC105458145 [Wasmannia auropunctata]
MATLTTLTDKQADLGSRIAKTIINLQKAPKDRINIISVTKYMETLNERWQVFSATHYKMLDSSGFKDTEYAKSDYFTQTEEAYYDALGAVTTVLEKLNAASEPEKVKDNPSPTTTSLVRQLQLPKIDPPEFSGDFLEWKGFRDLFASMVGNVPTLSDVQKLLYLKRSLKGEAAEVIVNTPLTDDGFKSAWNALCNRYGNERVLSHRYLADLFNFHTAEKSSASELRRVLDRVNTIVRALSSLQKPIAQWDEIFLFALTNKLDSKTRIDWETSLGDGKSVPKFEKLCNYLENRIQALRTLNQGSASSAKQENTSKPTKFSKAAPSKARSFNSTTNGKSKPPIKCIVCSESHSLINCTEFRKLTPAAKREKITQLRACINCLNPYHLVNKCASKHSCFACGQRHHTTLHDSFTVPVLASSQTSGSGSGSTTSVDNISVSNASPASSSTALTARAPGVGIVSTARVLLTGPSGKTLRIRALLDTGSDSSLVSEWVAQTLRLPKKPVRVEISGIEAKGPVTARASVSAYLGSPSDNQFKLPIEALVLPSLPTKLPAR